MQFNQRTFALAAATAFLFAPPHATLWLQAQAQSKPVKASRELAATVIVSPDDAWVQAWNTPQAPHITRLHEVEVDQKVTVGVLLSGLRAVRGQIRYRVATQILDPKGKAIFDRPDFSTGNGLAPAGSVFLLVNPTFDFTADNGDPKGAYRFRAIVTDLNRPKNAHPRAMGEWKVLLK